MNVAKIVLLVVFVAFTAFTAEVVYLYGYMGFFEWAVKSPVTIQLSLDLVISLVLISGWMISDARRQNRSAAPFLVLTLVLGSIGPMLYLLTRPKSVLSA